MRVAIVSNSVFYFKSNPIHYFNSNNDIFNGKQDKNADKENSFL